MKPFGQHECQLRRIDPARNMARFYRVSVGRNLFGDFSVVPEWGRLGTIGRVRVDLFENEHMALGAFEAVERVKKKRGYYDVEDLSEKRCS